MGRFGAGGLAAGVAGGVAGGKNLFFERVAVCLNTNFTINLVHSFPVC
jgi:hypothetical protein